VSARRFLLSSPPERGRAVLGVEESKHAVKVLRLAEGDAVVLFDGRGTEWPGTIERASRKGVIVAAGEARPSPRPAGPSVVLGTAVPKGKRMSTLLSMATEAGVDVVVPVVFARSVVREVGESKVVHWQRTIVEAAKQCGRPWMPALEPECALAEFLARPKAEGERRLVPTTAGTPPGILALLARAPAPAVVTVLVGPEGGFKAAEEEAAVAAGYEPCALGTNILRVETAAVAAVVMSRSARGESGDVPK
jgi:16S rRNA (uracil1498-N3)-methyltransferase